MASLIIGAAGFTSYKAYDNYRMSKYSDLMLKNLEALSDNGNENVITWDRDDEDCTYKGTAKRNLLMFTIV